MEYTKIAWCFPYTYHLSRPSIQSREFDRAYEIYQSQNPRGPRPPPPARNRNLVTDETQINAAVPQRPKPFGKLTAEEKDRRFKNKLCLYCGKLAIWREPVTRRKKMMPDT